VTPPPPDDRLVIRGRRVVTRDGLRAASIHVADGRISRISTWEDISLGDALVDAGNWIVMPGVVDTHVHVNEPGRTEWEGFVSATQAAAAGGVTTILDMPLNSIPATTSVEALNEKIATARGKTAVNVEFIGGVVPGNTTQLDGLARAGVRAFKCFLTPSGVDEFANVNEGDLREAFPVLAALALPLMVHAEDPTRILPAPSAGARTYATYLASRPPDAERSAIEMLVRLLDWCPTPVHIVHLSSAKSLDVVRDARARGLPITVETCPHYLTFAAEEIPDGATEFKCAPPIRESGEREELWRALIDGRIDLVASDHSPCPPELKGTDGDFFAAWGGISSLQLSLAAVWTGARSRGVAPERIAEWMSAGPAKLAGLHQHKGALDVGFDADITIWDPEAHFVVDGEKLLHRHHLTPYLGRELYGAVRATYVAGRCVFRDSSHDFPSQP
jgi:allantoinase